MKVIDVFWIKLFRPILALFFCTILIVLITTAAAGRPFRLDKVPDQGKNFKCKTCHTSGFGGKSFNPFGLDYQKIGLTAGDSYTDELADRDSDNDGFTNRQEFDAGTNPGDPKSKPER